MACGASYRVANQNASNLFDNGRGAADNRGTVCAIAGSQ